MIAEGKHLVGTWVKLPAPELVEILAAAGLDLVVIDLEHGTLDLTTVSQMIGLARGLGLRPFVRVAGRTARDVQPALDAGALGIVVPHVDDVAAAREAVQAIRFPPLGQRGASPSGRAGGWGQASLPDYLRTGADVCVVAQVESLEGLDNIGAIAGVHGIDAVFIGEVDLAASTRMAVDTPALRIRIAQAEAACREGGFLLAGGAVDGAEAARRFARGYGLVMIGTDISLLRLGAAQAASAAREAAQNSAGQEQPETDRPAVSAELTQLITDVWFEIDHTDGSAVADRFTADASLTITGAALRGRVEIDEFYASRHARGPRVSRHCVTNVQLLEVGERSATAISALILYAEDGEAPRRQMHPALVADVHDEFVRVDGRWLIHDRRIVAQFLPEKSTLTVPANQSPRPPPKEQTMTEIKSGDQHDNRDLPDLSRFPLRTEKGVLPLVDSFLYTDLLPEVPAFELSAGERHYRDHFVGITDDGAPRPGLYSLADTGERPLAVMAAARAYLDVLAPYQRTIAQQPMDSPDWRLWTNAIPTWTPKGLRLERLEDGQRQRALDVIEASLSPEGFTLVRAAMKLNGALGELVDDYLDTLTEFAYWFTVFGEPESGEPWGWQLMGHHIDLHCVFVGSQLVFAPVFIGAEPTVAVTGIHRGVRALDDETTRGLEFRRSLTPSQEPGFLLSTSIDAAALPPELAGPWNGRHLGGAGSDNLILPPEGIRADELTSDQQDRLVELLRVYLDRMPHADAKTKLDQVIRHFAETRFIWRGGHDDQAAFYYRIHSPVLLVEYDNHPGVFLANEEPDRFHVHTIVREPNGNDYAKSLLAEHYALHHGGPLSHHQGDR
ncbi:aldolase/citrate lyase family protein [Streptomyces sp. SID13031]|uniref:aldolase/citrate lyase family protein n=1 Tax=Streptomyces sp. SID13031 TaxID=2706046 RepID=UPI0013C955C6|nr:DUF3500 domain-containing protein [Streptomyces sp. SID13031]